MKKRINLLIACGTGIVLMCPNYVNAQNNDPLKDTVVIRLEGSDKILFIGNDMETMMEYKKSDSLKMLFLTDWTKALDQEQLTSDAAVVHYFVHGSGKRRLKAENAEFSTNTVDVGFEMKRLDLDLPKYQYILYDMEKKYQWQIYVANPEQLKAQLEKVSIDMAVQQITHNKKDSRKNFKITVNTTNDRYEITDRKGAKTKSIEFVPLYGVSIMGTLPAATLGSEVLYSISNKYGSGLFKFGIGTNSYALVDMANAEISNVNLLVSYEAKILFNLNGGSKTRNEHWLGLQGGFMQSTGLFNNAFKFGFLYRDNGPLKYSFDLIPIPRKQTVFSVSVYFPF